MSYSDKCFHPAEILNSHPFMGNFYNKGISFLYEGLKQLGQAITSEISLLSSLEDGGVRSEEALPGGRSWMLGNGHSGICSVLLKVPCPASPMVRDSLAMPLESVPGLCAGSLSLLRNTIAHFVSYGHSFSWKAKWLIDSRMCLQKKLSYFSWENYHFSSCNIPEINKNLQALTLKRKRLALTEEMQVILLESNLKGSQKLQTRV